MACGCPVVASTAGGASEAVVDGQTGLLVPPGDVAATATALDHILANPALGRHMGEQGRQRVEHYFALDQYVGRILATYQKAIVRSQQAPERFEGVSE
jgi:glycosyltransferase involved in cell wall biosynthesis